MRVALRIIGFEYLQNYPVLAGLMFALHASTWPVRLLCMALGALGTAVTIALTERLKLAKNEGERPADMLANTASFFAGQLMFLLYSVIVRAGLPWPLLADCVLGCALGALIGLVQALAVDERRLNREALAHTLGLALSGAGVMLIIGLLSGEVAPLLAAALTCIPTTLIIVRLDYWTRIVEAASHH
jgi:hypothetical protein